jgi:hypothetical protein
LIYKYRKLLLPIFLNNEVHIVRKMQSIGQLSLPFFSTLSIPSPGINLPYRKKNIIIFTIVFFKYYNILNCEKEFYASIWLLIRTLNVSPLSPLLSSLCINEPLQNTSLNTIIVENKIFKYVQCFLC